MKKIIFIVCSLLSTIIFAQVGINTDLPKATLDITKSSVAANADGLLTPRLTGDELKAKDALYTAAQNSTVVYVTEAVTVRPSAGKTIDVTSTGFYYYSSSAVKWIGLNMPKFFYMPSVYFNTGTLGTATKDLYQLYFNQFTAPGAKSVGAADKIPVVDKNDLQYYITSYDNTVFEIAPAGITADGILTYKVLKDAVDSTFLNIIFVVK